MVVTDDEYKKILQLLELLETSAADAIEYIKEKKAEQEALESEKQINP